jgi:uncharacterized protein
MNRSALSLVFLLFLSGMVKSQTNSEKKLIEKVLAFPNHDVKLSSSWIKQREDLDIAYLNTLDPERLLHNFRVNAGLPSTVKPLEGWESPDVGLRGHFVGHYLSAVSFIVEKYQNPLLSQRLNYLVDELSKCQAALGDGYLSAFPAKDFDTLEKKFGGVWAPYYTYHKIMQGLLDVYLHTGNQKAYSMLGDMASYVNMRMTRLNPSVIRKMFDTTEANPANEAGAMNDVLYRLYLVSKNPMHLALANLFDPDWFATPLAKGQDILSGLHANTHLVLVNGFAQRYEIKQETKYLNAASNFWNMLIDKHAYVNGSSSGPRPNVTTPTSATAEHWGKPGVLSNTLSKEIAESCVTHNTQKLTSRLFTWTLDPKYTQVYMNTFYNAVLPSQSSATGAVVYHLPLGSPRQKHFLKENDFRCCNGTGIEAFASLNSGIYYHDASDLWINLYIPSKVDWLEKGMSFEQSGEFTADSAIVGTIKLKESLKMNLRFFIPLSADKVDVFVNGIKEKTAVKPQSYFAINRKWNNNDTIKLIFHHNFSIKTMPDDANVVAFYYGNTLLAFNNDSEVILHADRDFLLKNIRKISDDSFILKDGDKIYRLSPFYSVNSTAYGVYATIRNF